MPRQQFLDVPGGDSVTFDVVNGDGYRLCPMFTSEEDAQRNFDSIPNKKCRDDDILLISYPKTGANWLWEILSLMSAQQPEVSGDYKRLGMLEMVPEETHDALPSPRILNTHLNYKFIAKEARSKKVKTILLCRNPKDTVVSFYHHTAGISLYQYDGRFENYLAMFMRGEVDYGSYPVFLLEWQKAIEDNPDWPIHIVYYEDLKQNSFEEIKRLRDYLGFKIDDDLARSIAESCQFDNMKKTKEEKHKRSPVFKEGFNYYRKGQVGDWKNQFTVAQDEMFDNWWADNTKGLNMFTFKYA